MAIYHVFSENPRLLPFPVPFAATFQISAATFSFFCRDFLTSLVINHQADLCRCAPRALCVLAQPCARHTPRTGFWGRSAPPFPRTPRTLTESAAQSPVRAGACAPASRCPGTRHTSARSPPCPRALPHQYHHRISCTPIFISRAR